jgi:hypothetical protein
MQDVIYTRDALVLKAHFDRDDPHILIASPARYE